MATNLKTNKTGKKIRAFIYRMIAVGAFMVFIASSLMGREALVNLSKEGYGTLSGKVYYLTEFREYISYLYQQGMLSFAGIGDDQGEALKTTGTQEIQSEIRSSFLQEISILKNDILYYINDTSRSKSSFWNELDCTYPGILTNIPYPIFSSQDNHLLLPEDVELCCYWNGTNDKLRFFDFSNGKYMQEAYLNIKNYGVFQYKPVHSSALNLQLIFAFNEPESIHDYSSAKMRYWAIQAVEYRNQLMVILSSGILTLIFGFLSLISYKYGKAAKESYGKISVKLWLEGKFITLAVLICLWYSYGLGYIMAPLDKRASITPYLWLYSLIGSIGYLLWIDLKINGIRTLQNSIFVRFILAIRDYARSLPWQRKILSIFWSALLSGLFFFLLSIAALYMARDLQHCLPSIASFSMVFIAVSVAAFVAGVLFLLYAIRLRRFTKDCNALTGKISDLQKGESSHPLQLSQHSLLSKTASDLNELESGIDNAIEQRNRSNQMRVELITNVSHDLKTPLTSIINYADLLCEENLPQPASDYAHALSEKAYRLKNMVQDVFDLSKATTGNLPVEKHRLDLVKLIKQTLADMDEKISESSLAFKLNITDEPLMIDADGDKLYRVFQNLFVNAIQYSLDYSRVHIQLSAENGFAVAKVKNTSKGELDFDPSEIVERFVRSDSSRTTEGSGLGLSIVQSFTETCGGTFTIEIDADMFTACVRFPLSEETTTCKQTQLILPEEIETSRPEEPSDSAT